MATPMSTITVTRSQAPHVAPQLRETLGRPKILDTPRRCKDPHLPNHDDHAHITSKPPAHEAKQPPETQPEAHPIGPPASRRLEGLPAELRSKILALMPDLESLRSAVFSSPVLHAQYLYSRHTILRECLAREMQGYLVDAYAGQMSNASQLGERRTDKVVVQFLNEYCAWRSGARPQPDLFTVDAELLQRMASFHLSVARPIARLYAEWALANLRAGTQPSSQITEHQTCGYGTELSRTEEIRVFRALYHCEIFSHLFGQRQGKRIGGFTESDMNANFFLRFEPWETEAAGSFDLFVRDRYNVIFDAVQWDLDPDEYWGIDLVDEREQYMDGTIGIGLETLARLLAMADDHGRLVSEAKSSLATHANKDSSMQESLDPVWQLQRRLTPLPNAKDVFQDRRDTIRFNGDAYPGVTGPPLGWVLLWGGKYANIYGGYVPEALRRWGYVVWDEVRWDKTGARKLVAKQWETDAELVKDIQESYGWNPLDTAGCLSTALNT